MSLITTSRGGDKRLLVSIDKLNEDSKLDSTLNRSYSMEYYRSAYIRDNAESKLGGEYESPPHDTSDKGLTEDKGIVRYYPEKSIYPNFKEEINKLYGFGIPADLNTNRVITNQDFFSYINVISRMPITEVGNYLNNFDSSPEEEDTINRRNLNRRTNLGYSRNINIIPETPLRINLGFIDGIIYTTTTSILAESLSPIFEGSGVEIPCMGVLVDMITESLLRTSEGYNLDSRPLGTLEKYNYSLCKTNRRNLQEFVKGPVIVKQKTNRDKEDPYSDISNIKAVFNNMSFELLNLYKKEIVYDMKVYNGRVRENTSLGVSKNNPEFYENFMPLGTIVPLVRIYKDKNSNRLLFSKLDSARTNKLFQLVDLSSDTIDKGFKSSLLNQLTKLYIYRPTENSYKVIDETQIITGDEYIESKKYIINSLNTILGNEV